MRGLIYLVLGSLLGLPGCGRIAGIEALRCEPACQDEATRVYCDAAGNARTEACPSSTEECAKPACEAGACTFKPAIGGPCGASGGAYCNEGFACLGGPPTTAAIHRHTCLVADDGKVWCWGDNTYGQLGDGTNKPGLHPVFVRGLPGPAASVSAGYGHTCARLLRSGEVYCWGENGDGQCGIFPSEPILVPVLVQVPGLRFFSVHAAHKHTCAVTEGRTVYCWGNTEYGQCGSDPAVTGQRIVGPTQMHNLVVGHIQAVKDHTCATRAQQPTLVCWGSNSHVQPPERPYVNGKLGPAAGDLAYSADPIPVDIGVPMAMPGIGADATYVITRSGNVYAWGGNERFQLGVESRERVVRTPTLVMRATEAGPVPLAGAANVLYSSGPDQCMRMANRTEYGTSYFCWGVDGWGELGAGTEEGARTTHPYAIPLRALDSTAGGLARGEDHTCAAAIVDARTEIQCYGRPGFLGNGSPRAEDGEQPSQLIATPVVWDPANFAPALE